MEIIAINFRKLRASKGYTQKQVADLAGVTKTTIANIEQNVQGKEPSVTMLNKLALALKVPLKAFFEE